MFIYGKNLSDDAVREFVKDHLAALKANKHDRFHAIMELLPSGALGLDYGCGWGTYSDEMLRRGNKIVAIDYSENEVDICKLVWGQRDDLEFRHCDIAELQDDSFDFVLSNQVIEHVHNVGHYLSSINRVLKTGGQLIISTPNVLTPRLVRSALNPDIDSNLMSVSKAILENYDKTHDHINCWDPVHFVRLCSSVGFLFDRYVPTEGIPLPTGGARYAHIGLKGLRNLSYTMTFRFIKVKDAHIACSM